MNIEETFSLIKDTGYVALYFLLWLGFLGVPIPNEVILVASGMIAATKTLHPIVTFFVTYAGILSSITTLYLLGRFNNRILYKKAKRNTKTKSFIEKGTDILQKYGHYSLCISYFLPFVRHVIPFLAGSSKMPFAIFAFYAYLSAFAWTITFYVCGYFFGNNLNDILAFIHTHRITLIFLLGVVLTFISILVVKKIKSKS